MSVETVLFISNIVTFLVLLVVIGVHVWTLRSNSLKEEKYIQALIAKDSREYNKAIKTPSKDNTEVVIPQESPYIAESELSDDEFFDNIEKMNDNN